VYLTFEDIEDVHNPVILDLLSEHGAYATFFISGEQLSQYTETVLRILAEGHAVGLHGMTSDETALWKTEDLLAALDEENELLYALVRRKTRLVRLPEGSQSGKLYLTEKQRSELADHGYNLWDWNISAMDHDRNYNSDRVLSKVHEALVVSYYPVIRMHCTETAAQVLPSLLQRLNDADVSARMITEATVPVVFPMK
jgi:peptidoglycan/xylan/chitin deacetylase (PgdA/CDA1 family)